jgi:eukaryotic-like serine/threonine-protein kinase
MNEQQAAELISKSLSGELSEQERAALQAYKPTSEEAKTFAHLSALIQKSLTVEAGDSPSDGRSSESRSQDSAEDSWQMVKGVDREGLSEVAKERILRSIRESSRSTPPDESSDYREVAESPTTYFRDPAVSSNEQEAAEQTRHAVSRFTLIRKIGEGGLGTVWLARDEKLRRNVAIKEMKPQAAESSTLWKRFQREAEITGHLEHPNVVPLYISGVNPETGLPFYAMRFLGRQTLLDAIREYHARRAQGADTPVHLHRLLSVFLDICQAIGFAHSRGVVHRDLKPENVALDSFGQVVVLDWGLAKLENDGELSTRLALGGGNGSSDAAHHTLVGDVVGTPLYMAPEQAAGELEAIDQRTDVYGLGAILFSILTGVAPHQNTPQSSSTAGDPRVDHVREILDAIANSETPRPRDLNPDVPSDLESICMRAMAREKYARQASVTELADEVEGWIAGKHAKQARYDALRMSGRDLKSRLCVQVRQFAVTAQFIVELPPIQGLLQHLDADESGYAEWRERLSNILLAVAKTKATLTALSFSQFTQDKRINELVRIERSLHDAANIRGVPQSRLRHGAANTFHKIIMEQFPGEYCIDFDSTTAGSIRLIAGVPVFHSETEEPAGLVLVEAEVENLVRPEIEASEIPDTVYLVDDKNHILFTTRRLPHKEEHVAGDTVPKWPEISRAFSEQDEFIDGDREVYATRLMFPQKLNSLRVVLHADS